MIRTSCSTPPQGDDRFEAGAGVGVEVTPGDELVGQAPGRHFRENRWKAPHLRQKRAWGETESSFVSSYFTRTCFNHASGASHGRHFAARGR